MRKLSWLRFRTMMSQTMKIVDKHIVVVPVESLGFKAKVYTSAPVIAFEVIRADGSSAWARGRLFKESYMTTLN